MTTSPVESYMDHMVMLDMKEPWYNEYRIPRILMPIRDSVMEKVIDSGGIPFEVFVDELIDWIPKYSGEMRSNYEIALPKLSYSRGIDKMLEGDFGSSIYYFLVADKYLPNNLVILRHLGLASVKLEKPSNALDYYKRLVELSQSQHIPPKYMAEAAVLARNSEEHSIVKRILPYLKDNGFSWAESSNELFVQLTPRLE